MKTENQILTKSFALAARGYRAADYLRTEKKEFIISNQLARCTMSIGANAEEANASQYKKEFVSKLQISFKEAREALYWVRLSVEVGLFSEQEDNSLKRDIEEVLYLLSAIITTTKKSLK